MYIKFKIMRDLEINFLKISLFVNFWAEQNENKAEFEMNLICLILFFYDTKKYITKKDNNMKIDI